MTLIFTPDIQVFSILFMSFLMLLVIQMLLGKLLHTKKRIFYTFLSFIPVEILMILTIGGKSIHGLSNTISISPTSIAILLACSIEFFILALVYLYGMYLSLESSIRIKIFMMIYRAQHEGLSTNQMKKIFSVDKIIQSRIDQLIDAKKIYFKDGYYCNSRKTTYYDLRNQVNDFISRLFPTNRASY